jgi:signal peptidase II
VRRRVPYAALALGIVVVDQLTKRIVDRLMEVHESRSIIDGVLALTYVRNRGAAFGILSDADLPYQSLLFAVVSLLALGAIVGYSWKLPLESRLPQSALALITGGAIGNLVDRAWLGYVVDFVDVYWRTHHWPMFNVADSAITVGVGLLILDILRSPGESPAAEMEAVRGTE